MNEDISWAKVTSGGVVTGDIAGRRKPGGGGFHDWDQSFAWLRVNAFLGNRPASNDLCHVGERLECGFRIGQGEVGTAGEVYERETVLLGGRKREGLSSNDGQKVNEIVDSL